MPNDIRQEINRARRLVSSLFLHNLHRICLNVSFHFHRDVITARSRAPASVAVTKAANCRFTCRALPDEAAYLSSKIHIARFVINITVYNLPQRKTFRPNCAVPFASTKWANIIPLGRSARRAATKIAGITNGA